MNRQPSFQFIHRTEDLGWSAYCYTQLKDFLPLSSPAYKKNIDPRLKKGYSESYVVQSRTHTRINVMYEEWYPAGKKVIPFHFLNRYLNEEALAWWYLDDGHLKVVNGKMSKIILSKESFSADENVGLINLLYDKFRLHFVVDGQNRLILYDQFQIMYFLRLVSPWLQDSMSRKAAVELPLRPIAKPTTVYLPSSVQLTKPTVEINDKLTRLHSFLYPDEKIVCHHTLFNLLRQSTVEEKDCCLSDRDS